MTKEQFSCFFTQYMASPAGQKEFFARTVFAAFDRDGNNELDETELDAFLNLFYEAGSIFYRDKRLPEKSRLRQLVMECDRDGDGRLSFDEMADVISGKMTLLDVTGDVEHGPEPEPQASPHPEAQPQLESVSQPHAQSESALSPVTVS